MSKFIRYRPLIFVEDYYKLFTNTLYKGNSYKSNIYFLNRALSAAESNKYWCHPVKSLAYINYSWSSNDNILTEVMYKKYKELIKMYISILLTETYTNIGLRYDKENIYWFNIEDYEKLPYIKNKKNQFYLRRALKISKSYYNKALSSWKKAEKYASNSINNEYNNIKYLSISFPNEDLEKLEEISFKIINRKLKPYKNNREFYDKKLNFYEYDYDKKIKKLINRISENIKKLDNLIQRNK